jgi:hypothetical protein
MLQPDVPTFRPPELQKSFAQRRNPQQNFRVVLGVRDQDADPLYPVQLLRAHRERQHSGNCATG